MSEMEADIDVEVVVRFCGYRTLQQTLFYGYIGV